MNNAGPSAEFQMRRIGPDRVLVGEKRVLIDALHEMPDWKIREFCKIAIYFEDRRYFLAEQRPGEAPFARRYVLLPWKDEGAMVRSFFTYDSAAVAEREKNRRAEASASIAHKLLLLFFPFLGFLWSGAKEKLAGVGINARSATGASIFVEFLIGFLEMVFWMILLHAGAGAKQLMLGGLFRAFLGSSHLMGIPVWCVDICVTIVCLLDFCVRYTHHLKNDERERVWGFMEWILPSRRKRFMD